MKFSIYETDSADPLVASNVTSWGPDPVEPEYDPEHEWNGRGAHVTTLGGRLDQDYGVKQADRKVRIAGRDLSEDLRVALRQKYDVTDKDWHFTDGSGEVLKVRFSRVPRGFVAIRDARLWAGGLSISNPPPARYIRFKYEILLLVVSKVQ